VRKLLYALTPLALVSCGGNTVQAFIGASGGELCLPNRRVCISVPLNGVPDDVFLHIRPSNDAPAAALSEAWQIGPDRTVFLKEATVTFKYDSVDAGDLNPVFLRVYTRALLDGGGYGDWVALDDPSVDRVRVEVKGKTLHLSPFVILRADLLPDGGVPVEGDAGSEPDSGVIICPPPCMPAGDCNDGQMNGLESDVDCGGLMCVQCVNGKLCNVPDDCESGRCVSGRCRAVPDAGIDAGFDAGVGRDAGFDAGVGRDAGFDAGVDAGFDAGVDAGFDAGDPDAGDPDAGDGG
jgi:hypothetical protein